MSAGAGVETSSRQERERCGRLTGHSSPEPNGDGFIGKLTRGRRGDRGLRVASGWMTRGDVQRFSSTAGIHPASPRQRRWPGACVRWWLGFWRVFDLSKPRAGARTGEPRGAQRAVRGGLRDVCSGTGDTTLIETCRVAGRPGQWPSSGRPGRGKTPAVNGSCGATTNAGDHPGRGRDIARWRARPARRVGMCCRDLAVRAGPYGNSAGKTGDRGAAGGRARATYATGS